jgi:cytochrome c-type biogenesis protein CcmE
LDLTPAPVASPRRRNRMAYAVIAVVVVALGVVVYQALSSASLYFYNADEAVTQRADIEDKRFRLQGTVLGGYDADAQPFEFTVAYDGARVVVHHDGDPPDLFEAGIPVVLEGRWSDDGDWFDSDRILVKHSAQYEADNEDRLEDARTGGTGTNQP